MERKKIVVADMPKIFWKPCPREFCLRQKRVTKVNSMTIAWGTLGIEWATPIFVAFIREHRFTRELLDKNPEFTVNIPFGEYNKKDFRCLWLKMWSQSRQDHRGRAYAGGF